MSFTTLENTIDTEAPTSPLVSFLEAIHSLRRPKPTTFQSLTAEAKASFIDQDHPVTFGKLAGWDITGALRKRWDDSFFPLILETVNESANKAWILRKSNAKESTFAIQPYMLGTLQTAQPFIVTVCNAKSIADRISKLVRKMPTIKEYGFQVHTHKAKIRSFGGGEEAIVTLTPSLPYEESSQPPSTHSSSIHPPPSQSPQLTLETSRISEPLPPSNSASLFGQPIRIAETPLSSISLWSWATLGGLIQIGNVIYGMTVAHAFTRDLSLDSDNHEDPSDSDTDSTISEPPDSIKLDKRGFNSVLPMTDIQAPETPAPKAVYRIQSGDPLLTGSLDFLSSNASLIGTLSPPPAHGASSGQFCSTQNDWALVRVDDTRLWGENQMIDSDGKKIRCNSVSNQSVCGDVLLASSKYGPLKCYSNGVKTALFLSATESLQEAYQINVLIGMQCSTTRPHVKYLLISLEKNLEIAELGLFIRKMDLL
ncbi:MAG: hypothetical protein Q9160_003727 [Pyrenula sp. 1 TL-2023]